jgi:inorganic pyrophosphatase
MAKTNKRKPANSIEVIVETTKGSRNKYTFDPEQQAFRLKKVLPAGMTFPCDFGFVPGTQADDGDPIDVLLLMDQTAFPGCRVECRLIGVIEAEQQSDQGWERNDRLVAVALQSEIYATVRRLEDLGRRFVEQLGEFFVNYHRLDGNKFKLKRTAGPARAKQLVRAGKKN